VSALRRERRGSGERSLGDAAASGTRVTLASQAVRVVVQVGSVAVLARLLTPAEFGLVAMVTAVLGIAEILRDSGLMTAAVQAKTLSRDEQTNLFWVNTGLGALCAAAGVAATPLVVAAYGEERLAPLVVALSVVFFISGVSTQFRADLSRSLRFGALSVTDVTAQLAGVAAAVGTALAGGGVWALVAQQLVQALTACVANAVSSDFRPGLPRRGAPLGRFFRVGGSLLGARSISYVTQNIDNIALGVVAGPVQLGLYSRGYQLLMVPLAQINTPLSRIALPVLGRAHREGAGYEHYVARAQLAGCYVTATVFAVAAGLAAPLVAVLFGPAWSAAAPVFAALAVGGVFRAVQQLAYWLYVSSGSTGAQLRMSLATQPVIIAAILVGLHWGALGVAVGHSAGYLVFWVVSLHLGARAAGVPAAPLFRTAGRALLLVALPVGSAAWLGGLVPGSPLLQIAAGLLAAAAAAGVVALCAPAVRRDLDQVRRTALRVARGGGPRRPAAAATAPAVVDPQTSPTLPPTIPPAPPTA